MQHSRRSNFIKSEAFDAQVDGRLTIVFFFKFYVYRSVAVLGKNIWGVWPLIIWEATTAKRKYVLHRPTNVLFCIDVSMRIKVSARSKKNWGGLGKVWGLCPLIPT